MLKGLFVLGTGNYERVYGPEARAAIDQWVDIYAPPQTREAVQANPAILRDADVIFSGWGGPYLDQAFLDAAPALKVVFYGAGSVKYMLTDAFWERDILITSAAAANAVPVMEYTLAQIFFCLKSGWRYAYNIKREARHIHREFPVCGAYGATVGIISLGLIGRLVCERLRPFDLKLIAYDPYVGPEDAAALGVEMCRLDEIFARADVVSLHTPWLPETVGMITGAHLAAMKPYAAFINTARGAVVREDEMIEVLKQRPDIQAVLDVTYPEPPAPGSPLFTLPNVLLTPHIAGAMGNETRRMGQYMVEELRRYVHGEPLRGVVSKDKVGILA
ncbi:MAG: hydroxyacid dehydrogenase [Anaerolineae bacterium]|nr:hydroxyacid dehydrogenase [Anaerolineae bacterium]